MGWLWLRDPFNFLVPLIIPGAAKASNFKFCTLVRHVTVCTWIANCLLSWRGHGHMSSLISGGKCDYNISEMAQDRGIVTIED